MECRDPGDCSPFLQVNVLMNDVGALMETFLMLCVRSKHVVMLEWGVVIGR